MPCYLLHFDRPFAHARHYLGFVETLDKLDARLDLHRRGLGSVLVRHAVRAGITFELARIWPDADRHQERRMKNRGHACRCPICKKQVK